jgi:hypothetical protein
MPGQRFAAALLVSLGLPFLLFTTAAGGGAPGRSDAVVAGRVYYKKWPLNSGMVVFIPEGDKGRPVRERALKERGGAINRDGTYRIVGAPLGKVVVIIDRAELPPPKEKVARPKELQGLGKVAAPPDPVRLSPVAAEKYGNPLRSGLGYTVVKGRQTFDIYLTD